MQLDIDFFKHILQSLRDDDKAVVSLGSLMSNLGMYDIDNFKFLADGVKKQGKLYHHLKMLVEIESIVCSTPSLGFLFLQQYNNGDVSVHSPKPRFELTFKGHELLESLGNKTLFDRLKPTLEALGIATLKQIPALAIKVILS